MGGSPAVDDSGMRQVLKMSMRDDDLAGFCENTSDDNDLIQQTFMLCLYGLHSFIRA